MSIIGVTFENQALTSKYDGLVQRTIFSDGALSGCAVTASGVSISIATGFLVICGRVIRIASAETIVTDPTYADGYARVKVRIDLNGVATTTEFTQVSFVTEYSEAGAFAALTQNNINTSGSVYEAEIATVKYVGGAIDSIVRSIATASKCLRYASEISTTWTGAAAPYTQDVTIAGILAADEPHIAPVYSATLETAISQKEAWSMVSDAEAGAGKITFTCFEDKPTVVIPIQVEVLR